MSTSDRTLNSLVVHLVQLELLQTFQGGMISAFPKEQFSDRLCAQIQLFNCYDFLSNSDMMLYYHRCNWQDMRRHQPREKLLLCLEVCSMVSVNSKIVGQDLKMSHRRCILLLFFDDRQDSQQERRVFAKRCNIFICQCLTLVYQYYQAMVHKPGGAAHLF